MMTGFVREIFSCMAEADLEMTLCQSVYQMRGMIAIPCPIADGGLFVIVEVPVLKKRREVACPRAIVVKQLLVWHVLADNSP